MDHIFAPWRLEYVTGGVGAPGCVFCTALARVADADSLVVSIAPHSFVLMNRYPYNPGHLMIAPRRHAGSLAQATPEELSEMMALARRLEQVLQEAYRPDGVNLGMNLGRPAGAGVPDHIHLHLVPRWTGDTSFMTVVGGTRVLSEDPATACARLRSFFDK
jgi:ATP adenylyltransferase